MNTTTTDRQKMTVAWNFEMKRWTLDGVPMRKLDCPSNRQLAEMVWSVYGEVDVLIDRGIPGRATLFAAEMAQAWR